jgi:hypothetical protein
MARTSYPAFRNLTRRVSTRASVGRRLACEIPRNGRRGTDRAWYVVVWACLLAGCSASPVPASGMAAVTAVDPSHGAVAGMGFVGTNGTGTGSGTNSAAGSGPTSGPSSVAGGISPSAGTVGALSGIGGFAGNGGTSGSTGAGAISGASGSSSASGSSGASGSGASGSSASGSSGTSGSGASGSSGARGGSGGTGGSSAAGGSAAGGGAAGTCGGATLHGCYVPQPNNHPMCPPQSPEQSAFYPPMDEWHGCNGIMPAAPFGGDPDASCSYKGPTGQVPTCLCDTGLHWLCTYPATP